MKLPKRFARPDRPALASTLALGRAVAGDFRRLLVPLVLFEVAYKGLVGPLWLFGTAWLLPALVEAAGRDAVTNADVVGFALSPRGLIVVGLAGAAATWLLLVEHVGVMAIAALGGRGQPITARRLARMLAASAFRVLRVGSLVLLGLIGAAAPALLLAGMTYLALISRHDINYYLADRPASFAAGLGVAALALAGAVAAGLGLSIRWSLALPILLLEARPAGAALRESWRRVRGASWRLALVLLGWQAAGFLGSALTIGAYRRAAALALGLAGHRASVVVPLASVLVAGHGLVLAALSFAVVAVQCLLIMRLYEERTGPGAVGGHFPPDPAAAPRARGIALAGATIGLAALAALVGASARVEPAGRVEVTAHRGESLEHPENTLAAVRGAIEAGADYAEIDVHLTVDGAIVLLHDDDLMRVAGDPRRIGDLTLAEARALDVGRRFRPRYSGERIPTLAEVIALARGRIKLNIELKAIGRDRRLAGEVARLIRRERFERDCLVASLEEGDLAEVKRHNPRVRVAAIVTYAIGDISRLRVDALSVNRRILTDRLLRDARRRGIAVAVWTVDDPGGMVEMMERGVANIVTNRPRLLVEARREREGLTEPERRLLVARRLLGMGR